MVEGGDFVDCVALHTGWVAPDHYLCFWKPCIEFTEQLLAESLKAHVEGDDFVEYVPCAGGVFLADNGGWCQTKVEADLDGQVWLVVQVLRHQVVVVFGPDWPAFLHIGVFPFGVAPDPVEVFAEQHLLVVTPRQVRRIFCFGIGFPPSTCAIYMVVSFRIFWQFCNIGFLDTSGLSEKVPFVCPTHFLLFCHTEPPMIVVHWVGIHDDAVPACTAISFCWVSSDAMGQTVDNCFG